MAFLKPNISKLQSQKNFKKLERALEYKQQSVRFEAAVALRILNWETQDQSLKAKYYVALGEYVSAKELGDISLPYLTKALFIETRTSNIIEMLKIIGEFDSQTVIDVMERYAKSEIAEIQETAIKFLYKSRKVGTISLLYSLMNDEDDNVRNTAKATLSKMIPEGQVIKKSDSIYLDAIELYKIQSFLSELRSWSLGDEITDKIRNKLYKIYKLYLSQDNVEENSAEYLFIFQDENMQHLFYKYIFDFTDEISQHIITLFISCINDQDVLMKIACIANPNKYAQIGEDDPDGWQAPVVYTHYDTSVLAAKKLIDPQNLKYVFEHSDFDEIRKIVSSKLVESSDPNSIKVILEHLSNCQFLNSSREIFTIAAIEAHNIRIVQLLIDNGCDVNIELREDTGNRSAYIDTRYRYNPLHKAVLCGSYDICSYLIEKGADVNATDSYGNSPLNLAIKQNNSQIAELILTKNVNEKSEKYLLHAFVLARRIDKVNSILSTISDIDLKNDNEETALLIAIKNNYPELVKLLLDKGADVNMCGKTYQTPLLISIENDCYDIAKMLIDSQQVDINCEGKNFEYVPLLFAIRNENHNIINLLLENGANINVKDSDGYTPLTRTVFWNLTSVAKYLVERGAKIIDTEYQCLKSALKSNNKKMLELLLKNGADINSKNDINKNTLLHLAVESSNEDFINFLLSKGADINSQDLHGRTPLHYAVLYGKIEDIKVLLDHGADVNALSHSGFSPVFEAAIKDKSDVIRLLIEYGADVNIHPTVGQNIYTENAKERLQEYIK